MTSDRLITLPGGVEVTLTDPMCEALEAMPTDGFTQEPSLLRELEEFGLIYPSTERNAYCLTATGRSVRAGFPGASGFPLRLPTGDQGGAENGVDTAGAPRPSVDPELDGIDRRRISAALVPPELPPPWWRRSGVPRRLISAGLMVVIVLIGFNPLLGGFVAGLAVAAGAVAMVRYARRGDTGADGRKRKGRRVKRAMAAAEAELAPYRGHLVLPRDLDEQACASLARAQVAVDSVLGSFLHAEGLLLDGPRNAVVLDDVEWSIAQGLARHTAARRDIQDLTTKGLADGAAAQRARESLAADTERIEQRIASVEEYARRVLRAELDHRGSPQAQRLHDVADSLDEAGAAHPHESAGLDALVEAQRSAAEVAALRGEHE